MGRWVGGWEVEGVSVGGGERSGGGGGGMKCDQCRACCALLLWQSVRDWDDSRPASGVMC